jgi:hypothetical protein
MVSIVILSDTGTYHFRRRVECVKWVAESMRSFTIVDDPGFHHLMKNSRPSYHIPPSRTVAQDVHTVHLRARERVATMLQVSFDSR